MSINRYTRSLEPGEGVEFKDLFGDSLTIAPAGLERIIFTIADEMTGKSLSAEFDRMDLIPIFKAAVDSTGLTPVELKETAINRGMIKRKASENRAERRRLAKMKPLYNPGSSFGI